MRKTHIAICLILALLYTPMLAKADGDDSLLALYLMNGNAEDASPHGNHAQVVGATETTDCQGVQPGAYYFDGIDDYISIGSGLKPDLPITISLWLDLEEPPSDPETPQAMLIMNDLSDGNGYCYGVNIHIDSALRIHARMNAGGPASPSNRRAQVTDDPAITLGEWQHIVAVWTGANDIRIYVDGVEMPGQYSGSGTSLGYSSTYGGYIGISRRENGEFIRATQGKIDNVRIYGRELAPAEIVALFQQGCESPLFTNGVVRGVASSDCPSPGSPLLGVRVDLYANATGDLVASSLTDELGIFSFQEVEAGTYNATVVTPMGYYALQDEVVVTLDWDSPIAMADYDLVCLESTADPRGIGFWKHQVGVANGGHGSAQIDATTLCTYLDLVEEHFNSNEINQVIVYEPPVSGLCEDKLIVLRDLLNLKGRQEMIARARQQLMALLLNTAALNMHLADAVSVDGATLSQAITWCDLLIDDPAGDHEMVRDIAEMINEGRTVPADLIPLDMQHIAYRQPESMHAPVRLKLSQNFPNPFNPATRIAFSLADAQPVHLAVYGLDGRLVVTLLDQDLAGGDHEVTWAGTDKTGRKVGSGTYICRLQAGGSIQTRTMLLIK